MELYRYFVSQPTDVCRHNHFCCCSTSVYCCKRIFRYRLSPETFGYTLVCVLDRTATRTLLNKPVVTQLLKKFPAFYGIRWFITLFTKDGHRSLAWAKWIQSTPSHPIPVRYIPILSSHLCLVFHVVFSLQVFRPKFFMYYLLYPCCMPCPSPPWLGHSNNI